MEVLLVMACTVSREIDLLCLCMALGRRPGSVKRATRYRMRAPSRQAKMTNQNQIMMNTYRKKGTIKKLNK